MRSFYIRFDYDHYCQGYEDATETLMVEATDYSAACALISEYYEHARNFKDLTLREKLSISN